MKVFIYACIILILCRLMGAYVFSTFDDAYITYRYSRNVAAGVGLVYNLHEKVLGTTAPLFAIIGIIPAWLKISIPQFFLLFNIFCDLGIVYIVYRFLFAENRILLILFILLFSLDPGTNRIAIGGMEANLFLLCSLLGMVLYFNQKKSFAFLTLSVIYFLRPEALILLTILFFYEWFETKEFPVKFLLLCVFIVAPVLFAMHLYYGHAIPQSVIVKYRDGNPDFMSLIRDIFFPHISNYIIFPLAIYGMIKSFGKNKYLRICCIWLILYAGAYCIKGPWIMNWYIYSIVVIQLIFASLAIREIALLLHFNSSRNKWLLFIPVLAVLCWLFICFYKGRSGQELMYGQLKKDLDPGRNTDLKFFADDIGAIGYYSRGYIYDNLMLVTPQAIDYPNLRERIVHVHPDYLFLYTTEYHINIIIKDSTLSKNYHFLKRYSANGETNFPENIKNLTGAYHIDYILWQRNQKTP